MRDSSGAPRSQLGCACAGHGPPHMHACVRPHPPNHDAGSSLACVRPRARVAATACSTARTGPTYIQPATRWCSPRRTARRSASCRARLSASASQRWRYRPTSGCWRWLSAQRRCDAPGCGRAASHAHQVCALLQHGLHAACSRTCHHAGAGADAHAVLAACPMHDCPICTLCGGTHGIHRASSAFTICRRSSGARCCRRPRSGRR